MDSKSNPIQPDLFPRELAEAKFNKAIEESAKKLAEHIDMLVLNKLLTKGTNGTSYPHGS